MTTTATPRPARPPASIAGLIIAAILCVAALYLASEFFVPLALALSFAALLRPPVRGLERLRVPAAAGAAIIVLGGVGIVTAGGYALSGPVSDWVDRAPASLRTARAKIRAIGRPLGRLSDAAEGKPAESKPAPNDSARAQRAPQAPQQSPPQQSSPLPMGSIIAQVLGRTTSFVSGVIEVLLLLFLMLATGDQFLRKMVKALPRSGDKRTAAEIIRETESIVARYLAFTALINVGQGILVGLALWALGMPDPLIWGLLTFIMEFIPYLGGATMVVLLLISGFTTFQNVGQVLLAPALYLVITTIQNNVVSPYVYGGGLKLNPLAVIIFVLFWWFVWGIPGVFLAIPIAATLKVLSDQIPRLKPLGELLGE